MSFDPPEQCNDAAPLPLPVPAAAEAPNFLEQFAHRVATRDLPPPPPAHGYDRASLETCIMQALRVGQLGLRSTRARTQARLCYALMQPPRLITRDLAAAAGLSRLSVYKVVPELARRGLVAEEYHNGRHYHFLTRAGEDWLLEAIK